MQVLERLAEGFSQRRVQVGLISLFVLVLAGLYLRYILVSGVGHDEVEHLHVGFRILNGLLPYRDFYQNHLPVYWIASTAFAEWFPFSINSILAGRALSITALAGCWLSGFLLLRQFAGGNTWLARLVYTWVVLLLGFDMEFHIARPDPAMTLFATAGLCLIPANGGISNARALFLGILYGLAASVSIKILPLMIVVPGVILAHCFRESSFRPGLSWFSYALGITVGILPLVLWILHHGLIEQFIADVWAINRAVSKHWTDSFGFLQLPIYPAAFLGMLAALASYSKPQNLNQNTPLILALALFAGLILSAISRHSGVYNLQALIIPLSLGFTVLALTACAHIQHPMVRPLVLAALLAFPTTQGGAKMARLEPKGGRIEQSELQQLMSLARPGDLSCLAFSPVHPVFCSDVGPLSNRWDLHFPNYMEDPGQITRFYGIWNTGVESALLTPPDILVRNESTGIWEQALGFDLISESQLERLDRLMHLYDVKLIGDYEIWILRDRQTGPE